MRYIETDADGNIFHIAEIIWPDGDPGDAHRDNITAQLAQDSHDRGARFHRLADNEKPTHDGHKLDLTTGKVRKLTTAETKARADAAASKP